MSNLIWYGNKFYVHFLALLVWLLHDLSKLIELGLASSFNIRQTCQIWLDMETKKIQLIFKNSYLKLAVYIFMTVLTRSRPVFYPDNSFKNNKYSLKEQSLKENVISMKIQILFLKRFIK